MKKEIVYTITVADAVDAIKKLNKLPDDSLSKTFKSDFDDEIFEIRVDMKD